MACPIRPNLWPPAHKTSFSLFLGWKGVCLNHAVVRSWALQPKLRAKVIHCELTAEIPRTCQKEAGQDWIEKKNFFLIFLPALCLGYTRALLHSVAKLGLVLVTWAQTVFVFTAEEKRPYPAARQGNKQRVWKRRKSKRESTVCLLASPSSHLASPASPRVRHNLPLCIQERNRMQSVRNFLKLAV